MLSKVKTYHRKIKKPPSLSDRQIAEYRHQAYRDLYEDDDDDPIVSESSPVENNSQGPKNWWITKQFQSILERLSK